MSPLKKLATTVLGILLLASAYGLWITQPPDAVPRAPRHKAAAASDNSEMPVIDQDTVRTARRLARLVTTAEEVPLAQSAVQLADHELDLAFAGALRHIEAHPPQLSPEAQQIQQRLDATQKQLDADTREVQRLTAELEKAPDAKKPPIQDRLDLAKSQVELEQDEVQQANADLLEAGGNLHQRIQMMQQEHESTVHATAAAPAPSAANPLANLRGLVGDVRRWLALRAKRGDIAVAGRLAAESAAKLATERQQIAADIAATRQKVPQLASRAPAANPNGSSGAGAPPAGEAPNLLNITRQLAAEHRRIAVRDERIIARRRLAEVYGQWASVISGQERNILHDALGRAAIVLAVLLALPFLQSWLEKLLGRAPIDRRQVGTLRSVIGVAMQLFGVVLILLVLVGVPGQIGTMVGLAGAGLTVALKDFIVAFVGWFVLMGKNGIRLGDWVEINGVSGEVVQLGMLHTVLLETGNWTDAGHPTGRRVTFTNSFATAGHYFNFSTTGQWLWDELVLTVPYDRDPTAIADAIRKEVVAATAESTKDAEQEWRRTARGKTGASFSAEPGIAVRPASGAVEVAVRYVTRASERFALRARLYQTAVGLLSQRSTQPSST